MCAFFFFADCTKGGDIAHISHFVIRTCETTIVDVIQMYNISEDFPLIPYESLNKGKRK